MKKIERIFARVCKKYGIENRPLTKADFYRICEGENINLINDEEHRPFHETIKKNIGGFYLRDKNNDRWLYMRSFFEKNFRRFTAFHELGHHFCGHLEGFQDGTISDTENEADYFSFLATGLKRRGAKNDNPYLQLTFFDNSYHAFSWDRRKRVK